ncbi:hypothetical protein HPB48_008479 [Haemaphysalis longicornis]|uniref:Uncharacterized protein n=1 Tax=Haemaphysalis longicornis TaxID=44386 RepID=A0A9J6FN37_HAELO|nr:hypothetical protein HPB48_008479 [Haemaphysalis longicornis]
MNQGWLPLKQILKCPIDNKEIVHKKVVDIELDKDHMDVYPACCFYASRGCKFWGPLSLVKRHFLDGCYFAHAKCSRCNKRVNRWQAVEHRAECKFGLLQEAIEAVEAVGTASSTEDFLCQMSEQEGGGCEGTDRAGAPPGSGDYAYTAPGPSPERYNPEKMPRRKPKVTRRYNSGDGARSLVWAADLTSPYDRGAELSRVSEGLPALPPPRIRCTTSAGWWKKNVAVPADYSRRHVAAGSQANGRRPSQAFDEGS